MASSVLRIRENHVPLTADDVPNLYEDEDEPDMGESNVHTVTSSILFYGIRDHLKRRHPDLQYFSDLNLYYKDGPRYPKTGSLPYVSPDGMVVEPYELLVSDIPTYTIGKEGPAPILTAEVLSPRTGQQGDLREKLIVYAFLKVPEYILVDVTGKFLKAKLLLKRLQADGTWKDENDPDYGVTSELGFRVILDPDDGQLRILDAHKGKAFLRPSEADEAVRKLEAARNREEEARRKAEQKAKALEAKLARLKKKKR
ncbi:MAG: Uma2 family endonuclease [Planctomycetes bacterium]|nr:Uma2 family endonuclease [Planctomycetota bacterium]